MNLLGRLYKPEFMLRKDQAVEPPPSAKDAYSSLLQMAWPAVTESFLVGLSAFVNMAMVGNLGSGAIAAVGVTNQPKFILLALFASLNTGVVAIIARRRGEQDREGALRTFRQAIVITLLLSAVMCAVGVLFAEPLLHFAGAKSDYIADAALYFRITTAALPISTLSMVITAAQRGAGNTRVSMRTNLTANGVNVILNFLLINGNLGFPALGVAGAAISTNIGVVAGLVIALVSVADRSGFLTLSFRESWRLDRKTTGLMVNIGASCAVEQVFLRIGFLVYAMMVADLGTEAFATHQIAMQIFGLSFNFGDGLAVASTALVGRSLGEKRPDLAIIYGKCGQRLALICSLLIIAAFTFAGYPLMSLFSDEAPICAKGAFLLLIAAASSPFQVSQVVLCGALRGAGDTGFVALTSLISVAAVRPFLTYLFIYPLAMGLDGAWYSMIIDQTMRAAISQWRFSRGKWTLRRI